LGLGSGRGFETDETLTIASTIMPTQTLLGVLTVVNLGLVGYQSVHVPHPAGSPDLLRGRGLEIVDDRGKVRASISILPEDPKHPWKGKPYPETVLLRLITADGRPNVKLGAGKTGAGLLIGGESDPTYVQVLAEGGETTVRLKNKDGRERVLRP
jgi:hypothetical protein